MEGLHSAPQHLWMSSQLRHIPDAQQRHKVRGDTQLTGTGEDRAHLTASPASRRAVAVPPEATRDRPTPTSLLPTSTSPVLSETLRSAATNTKRTDSHLIHLKLKEELKTCDLVIKAAQARLTLASKLTQ